MRRETCNTNNNDCGDNNHHHTASNPIPLTHLQPHASNASLGRLYHLVPCDFNRSARSPPPLTSGCGGANDKSVGGGWGVRVGWGVFAPGLDSYVQLWLLSSSVKRMPRLSHTNLTTALLAVLNPVLVQDMAPNLGRLGRAQGQLGKNHASLSYDTHVPSAMHDRPHTMVTWQGQSSAICWWGQCWVP